MTQTKMTKNVLYALIAVGSFGVCVTSSAMDKKSVVTRGENNYLPTAKDNLSNAQKDEQLNLTAIKSDIKRTEKQLQVQPLNLDQDSFEVTKEKNITSIAPRRTSNKEIPSLFGDSHSQRPKLVFSSTIMDNHRSEQEKLRIKKERAEKATQKKLAIEKADALKLEAILEGRNAIINEYSADKLVVQRPRSKTLPTSKKSSDKKQKSQPVQQQIILNDFDFSSVELTQPITNNTISTIDQRITRSTGQYPIEAPINLENAEYANQLNLTPLRRDVKKLQQEKK